MRPVVSWGDLGCPWVFWGNQTDPFNLVQVIAFTKICYLPALQINNCAIFVSLHSLCFGVYQN